MDEILKKWLPPEKCIESAQVQKTEAEQDKSGLISIPGVDTALGLRNCGGNTPVYINILEDFCNDSEARLVHISEALNQGNIKLYTTLVHALKGAARSIGAMETGEKAFSLERASAEGDLTDIKDKTTELSNDVSALINNIKSFMEQQEAADDRKLIDVSDLQLETLKSALAEMNIEAVNKILLNYAAMSLDSKTRESISEVEQHILMFEYDKAIEKINELF